MASDRSVRTDTPQPARPEPCVGLGGRRGRGSQGESSNPSFTAAWGLALSPGIAPGVTAGLPLTANGLTANKTLAAAAFPSQQTPISGTQRPLTANETASHGKRNTANIRGGFASTFRDGPNPQAAVQARRDQNVSGQAAPALKEYFTRMNSVIFSSLPFSHFKQKQKSRGGGLGRTRNEFKMLSRGVL